MTVFDYNPWLLMVSLLLAVLSGYVALGVAQRVATSLGRARQAWLLAGSVVIGWGVWAMHFVGMLAWQQQKIGFAPGLTLLSLLPAMLGAGLALTLTARQRVQRMHFVLAGLALGGGVGAMHYLGMLAMVMQPALAWRAAWVVASLLYAVCGSMLTLWVSRMALHARTRRTLRQWLAALLLGLTVAGMHYLGMLAVRMQAGSVCLSAGGFFSGGTLAAVIAVMSVLILGATWITTALVAHLQRGTRHAQTQIREISQALVLSQQQDGLTGLPNRAMLLRHLRLQLARARRGELRFALLLVHLNGLERVHETLGVQGADAALRAGAQTLQRSATDRGVLARCADNVFALIAPGVADAAALERLATHIMDCLHAPLRVLDVSITLSVRIGAALAPRDGEDAELLLQNAQAALNRTQVTGQTMMQYQPGLQRGQHQRMSMLTELREAIEQRQLVMHYQMIWDLQRDLPRGAEALVRWQHPRHGLLAPGEFVPLAEQEGLAVELDHAVLSLVAQQIGAWSAAGVEVGAIAVNLTAATLEREDFITRIDAIAARHAIDITRLRFELTESMVMNDDARVLMHLQRLRELGCCVLLDDFGTGHSSLARLRKLPLTALKIDQSFVRDALRNPADLDIVEAIIALAQKLHLGTIAEGVETEEQAAWLREIGCDAAQGYAYSRALDGKAFIAHMAKMQAPYLCLAPVYMRG